MNGIASLLDPAATDRVERLWQELEGRCGLTGVKITPFPHFSWQVAEGYDLPTLETALWKIVREIRPFFVHTTGLGLFTGGTPILYVPLVKDKGLLEFHARLWEATQSCVITAHPYYSPDAWVPHITLAFGDVNANNLGCAMQYLSFLSYEWEIQIDHLVFVAQSDGKTVETRRYRFGEDHGSHP